MGRSMDERKNGEKKKYILVSLLIKKLKRTIMLPLESDIKLTCNMI